MFGMEKHGMAHEAVLLDGIELVATEPAPSVRYMLSFQLHLWDDHN